MDLSEYESMIGRGSPMAVVVEELDTLFPPLLPTPAQSDREIMFAAGQRSVVEYLKRKLQSKQDG